MLRRLTVSCLVLKEDSDSFEYPPSDIILNPERILLLGQKQFVPAFKRQNSKLSFGNSDT